MIWKQISNLWNDKGFEICLGLCIAVLLIFTLYNKIVGKRGTCSKPGQYYSLTTIKKSNIPFSSRSPPRQSKGEVECRRVLQDIFRKPFPSKRPDFLRNPVTGGNFNLELDCYNSEMSLAIEYNGAQHYKYIPHFHRSKDHFLNQKYRDDMKRRICKEHGITLIEVPYTVKVHDIRRFLIDEIRKSGYKI